MAKMCVSSGLFLTEDILLAVDSVKDVKTVDVAFSLSFDALSVSPAIRLVLDRGDWRWSEQ